MLHQGEGCSMFMLSFMETREIAYIKTMAEMINQSPRRITSGNELLVPEGIGDGVGKSS